MTLLDTSAWAEDQLFEFLIEEQHIDQSLSNQTRSPIEYALMDFLNLCDESAEVALRVDNSSEPHEDTKYRTEVRSTAFQYSAESGTVNGITEYEIMGCQEVTLIYDEQLNAWLNRLNQSLESNSERPGLIVVQLRIRLNSPIGKLSHKGDVNE